MFAPTRGSNPELIEGSVANGVGVAVPCMTAGHRTRSPPSSSNRRAPEERRSRGTPCNALAFQAISANGADFDVWPGGRPTTTVCASKRQVKRPAMQHTTSEPFVKSFTLPNRRATLTPHPVEGRGRGLLLERGTVRRRG